MHATPARAEPAPFRRGGELQLWLAVMGVSCGLLSLLQTGVKPERSFGDMSECFRRMPMSGQKRSTEGIACCSCCCRQWQLRPSRVLPAFTESEGVQAMWKLKPTEQASAASAAPISLRHRLRAASPPSNLCGTALRLPLPSASPETSRMTGSCGLGACNESGGPAKGPPFRVSVCSAFRRCLSAVWLRTTSRCLHRQPSCRQRVRLQT